MGTHRTRSVAAFTAYREEMMRATISSSTATGNHTGSARWLERLKISVRAIRHLAFAEDQAGEQQGDRRVADHQQKPVAIEWDGRRVGIDVSVNGAHRR